MPKTKLKAVGIVYGPRNQPNFIKTFNENFAKLDRTNNRVSTGPENFKSPGNILKYFFCPGMHPGIWAFVGFVLKMF